MASSTVYMTESLIKENTGDIVEEAVHDLHIRADHRGRINRIENLTKYTNLQTLNLSGHNISRIEGLSILLELRLLSLANNKIEAIQGLANLQHLEELDLAGNCISKIGTGLKGLRDLRVLRLVRNRISQVSEFENLSSLKHLSSLSIHGNPVAGLPHCQAYAVFCARTLDVVDGEAVIQVAREEAITRFTETHNLEMEAKTKELEAALEAAKQHASVSERALLESRQREEEAVRRCTEMEQEQKKLQMELNLKHQRLECTLKQLSGACARISALEITCRISLPVAFRTSGSSLASDVSAELASLEASQRTPPVTTGAEKKAEPAQKEPDQRDSAQEPQSNEVPLFCGKMQGASLQNVMRGSVAKRSLGASLAQVDLDRGEVNTATFDSMKGCKVGSVKRDGEGSSSKIDGVIQRTKAALTEFLEELRSRTGGEINGCESTNGAAEIVQKITLCAEQQAWLKLELRRIEQARDEDSKTIEQDSLSFSNLVEERGTEVKASSGEEGSRAKTSADEKLMGRSQVSEDWDMVVMSDSESEEMGEGTMNECKADEDANCKADKFEKVGVKGRGSIDWMFKSEGKDAEETKQEQRLRAELVRSEEELQRLEEQALADAAASHGPTSADVATRDWPAETYQVATHFLQAMTANLVSLFEGYHSAASFQSDPSRSCYVAGEQFKSGHVAGEPSRSCHVAGELSSSCHVAAELSRSFHVAGELDARWDLLFSPENGKGGLFSAAERAPHFGSFELQSASATPGSSRLPQQSYRYADVSPESVVFKTTSALSSPATKEPFALGVDSDTAEWRQLSFASVQCSLEPAKPSGFSITREDPKQLLDASVQCNFGLGSSLTTVEANPKQEGNTSPVQKRKTGYGSQAPNERPVLQSLSGNTLASQNGRPSESASTLQRFPDAAARESAKAANVSESDGLKRKCRTLECQVAALTGLLEAEKAEKEILERWQEETEKRIRLRTAVMATMTAVTEGKKQEIQAAIGREDQNNTEESKQTRVETEQSLQRNEESEKVLELASLQQQLLELRERIEEQGSRLKETIAERDRAEEKVQTAQRELLEVQEQAGKAREMCEEEALERAETMKQTEDELSHMKGEAAKAREELEKLTIEVDNAKLERDTAATEAESAQRLMANRRKELDDLEKTTNGKRQETESESAKLRESVEGLKEKLANLEERRKEANQRLRGTESAVHRGEEELLRVQQQVSEAGGKLRKLWADERAVWQRLEKQQRELDATEGHVQALRKEEEEVEQRLKEARAELARADSPGAMERAEEKRNGGMETEAGAVLQERLAALQGELMGVQIHLLTSRRKCQSQEERALQAARDADVARRDADVALNELAQLKETVLNARQEAETAQEEARIAGQALEAVKQRLKGMVLENPAQKEHRQGDSLAKMLERVMANLDNNEGSGELTKELANLEEKISEKEKGLKVLEERVRAAKKSATAEEGKLKVLRGEARNMAEGIGKQRGQKMEVEAKRAALENQVKALTQKLESETQKVKKAQDEVRHTTDDLEAVRERVDEAEAKLKSVKEETLQAKQVYKRVKEEVREAKAEFSKARHELQNLERRWVGLKLEVTGAKQSVGKGELLSSSRAVDLGEALPEPSDMIATGGDRIAVRSFPQTETVLSQSKARGQLSGTVSKTLGASERSLVTNYLAEQIEKASQGRDAKAERETASIPERSNTDIDRSANKVGNIPATMQQTEAELQVAQNGLEQLLSQMHSLQKRLAQVSESDNSQSGPVQKLETLAETSLATCLEGVKQVHSRVRKACATDDLDKESKAGSRVLCDLDLHKLEEVCKRMRTDLQELTERNEALQRTLKRGCERTWSKGAECSSGKPCGQCRSLNAKFLEVSREAASLRLVMKSLKVGVAEVLASQSRNVVSSRN